MKVLQFRPDPCGAVQGDHGEIRRGIIYPGAAEKLKGHVHNGWHITIIMAGEGILRTPTGTARVTRGDAIEIEAHEVHELEALFGPLEYRCVGVKGF